MATLLLNRGRINLVKNVVKRLYFYLHGKTDMKYEIRVSEFQKVSETSQRLKFQLNPAKNKKLDFDPQNKECRNYSKPVMTSSILLWFWIEFVTYFHTSKFGFN